MYQHVEKDNNLSENLNLDQNNFFHPVNNLRIAEVHKSDNYWGQQFSLVLVNGHSFISECGNHDAIS